MWARHIGWMLVAMLQALGYKMLGALLSHLSLNFGSDVVGSTPVHMVAFVPKLEHMASNVATTTSVNSSQMTVWLLVVQIKYTAPCRHTMGTNWKTLLLLTCVATTAKMQMFAVMNT